jgi:hypothetical protein
MAVLFYVSTDFPYLWKLLIGEEDHIIVSPRNPIYRHKLNLTRRDKITEKYDNCGGSYLWSIVIAHIHRHRRHC